MASDERIYCLVPDCDEQPYPGNQLCDSHLRADDAKRLKGDRCSAPWAPFKLHTWKDGRCIHCGDNENV